MKYTKLLLISGLCSFILFACGDIEGNEKTSESLEITENETADGEIHEAELEVKGEFITIAEKTIRGIYQIDDFEIDNSSSSMSVFNSSNEKNSETGEEYKNIINGMGEFTYQDNIYRFSLLYSKTSEDSYKILFMDSNYNHDVGIDVPLESD